MKIFKLIEIDMAKERARLNTPGLYNKRQRRALVQLYELFEQGKWQECLDLARNKSVFPRNRAGEYDETEHIGTEVNRVLRQLGHENFYTQAQLLDDLVDKVKQVI